MFVALKKNVLDLIEVKVSPITFFCAIDIAFNFMRIVSLDTHLKLLFASFYVTNGPGKTLTLLNSYRFSRFAIHHQLKLKMVRRLLIAS